MRIVIGSLIAAVALGAAVYLREAKLSHGVRCVETHSSGVCLEERRVPVRAAWQDAIAIALAVGGAGAGIGLVVATRGRSAST